MKKILVVFLALTFVAVLGFAGGKGESAAPEGKTVSMNGYEFKLTNKKPKDIEIAVVYMNVTIPFAQFIKAGVDAAAKEFGVKAYMTGPTEWGTEPEIKVMEDLIAKRVDGISVAVLDIPGMTPAIQKALKAGIPVTCNNVDAPDSGRLGFVGEDLFLAGAATAESLVKHMGPKGKIIVSSVAIGSIWSRKRQDGVMSVLNKYPDIQIVDTVNAEGDEQSAYAALENSFIAHPDIRGHISFGGTDYLWGRLMENKKVGNADSAKPIWSTGHDLYEEKLLQIKSGWTTTAYGQNPYKQGYEAVKQLYEFLTQGTPPTVIDTGIVEVNRENVDEWLQKIKNGEPVG
jgi:simple sugar transport system substrate-binding protein/ribose transport system substrate-binding protein